MEKGILTRIAEGRRERKAQRKESKQVTPPRPARLARSRYVPSTIPYLVSYLIRHCNSSDSSIYQINWVAYPGGINMFPDSDMGQQPRWGCIRGECGDSGWVTQLNRYLNQSMQHNHEFESRVTNSPVLK